MTVWVDSRRAAPPLHGLYRLAASSPEELEAMAEVLGLAVGNSLTREQAELAVTLGAVAVTAQELQLHARLAARARLSRAVLAKRSAERTRT